MAALTVGLRNIGIALKLQLLMLQYLTAVTTTTTTTKSTQIDISHTSSQQSSANLMNSKQTIAVTIDNDFFRNEATERLILLTENNITKLIQDFKTIILEEMKKNSVESEHTLTDIIHNFTATFTKYHSKLQEIIQENIEQSKRNKELEEKLSNFTQEEINTQNNWVKENKQMYNTNKELEVLLANVTNRNEMLENDITSMTRRLADLQETMLKLTEGNKQLLERINAKDKNIQELEVKVKDTSDKNKQLNDNFNNVNAKYTTIQQIIGSTEPQHYCVSILIISLLGFVLVPFNKNM